MGKMLKWILIGGLVIGAWMFLVPPSIKCKVPVIGGNCQQTEEILGKFGVNPNLPPVTQLDDLMEGVEAKLPRQSNFARAQMLRGIY